MRVLFLRRAEGVPEGRQAPAEAVVVAAVDMVAAAAAAAVDMVVVAVAVAADMVVVAPDIWAEVARAQD